MSSTPSAPIVSRPPTRDDQDLFELQPLESRVMLSAEGFFGATLARDAVLDALQPGSLFQSAIVETVHSSETTSASTTGSTDGFFAAATPIVTESEPTSAIDAADEPVTTLAPSAPTAAESAEDRETSPSLTLGTAPVTPAVSDSPASITPTADAPTLSSSHLTVTTLPNGPPATAASTTTSQTTSASAPNTAGATLPLAASFTSALSSFQTQLPTWGSFFNLGSINFAGQGLSTLSLPVLPDSLSSLFDLGSKLGSVTLPSFGSAETKDSFVNQLASANFTVRSIEGGFSAGSVNIPASTGTTLLEGSLTLTIGTGFSIAPGSSGNTYNSNTPSVLAGLASSANLNGNLSWTANLSLTFSFALDSSAGFLLLGDSALNLTVTGNGTLTGNAAVGGASGTSVTGTANASLSIALGFRDPSARYALTQIGANTITPTATGTAGLSLTVTTGPVTFTFGATYNLSANLATRAVTQSVALTLTGTATLPGVTTTSGAPGTVSLTGNYNTSTQTWTINGSTASGLQMFGQTLNQLNVSVAITPSSFSGSFSAQLETNFLSNGSSPAVVNLSATYDRSVVSVTASATIASLNLGSAGSRLLAFTGASLGGTFTGNVATGALTGSLTISATSATFQPDQTAYTASITDGTDADTFGIVGSYDFGTSAFALTIDQFTLAVTGVFRAVASGFSLNYDRSKTDPAQVIAELNSLKVDLLALQQTGSPEPPSVTISKLTIRRNGFAFANATVTLGDYTLGGALKFGSLNVTLDNVDYTTGSAPAGTLGLSAASATLFPGGTASATLTTISGSFNLVSKAFSLTIANLNATVGSTLTFAGTGIGFGYDPTAPPSQKIITADTLTATLPSANVTGTLTGLEITAAGGFSAVSLALDSSGLAKTLGLGELLPFDISSLYAKFLGDTNGNGIRDPGETFSLTAFDLTVRGAFDFSKLSSLPFTPIIRIGPQGAAQKSFDKTTAQPFEFTVTVSSAGIKPKDIGPIEIGFSDLKIGGTVTLGGTILLGGYQDGVFVPTFGGSFSLVAKDNVKNLSGAVSATLTGTFDTTARTISANGSITVSFTYGDKVDIKNAQLAFSIALKADSGFAVSVTSFALTSGSVDSVTIKFGTLMTLSATGATFNFNATGTESVATFDSMTATFPGVLNLTGTATKFGFAANGSLITRDGFGVTISADASAIKWPTWLPISIDKLGIVWKNFDADPLDFSIILSASVTSLNGVSGLSVQGTVKDAIIDIGLLKDGKFPITGLGAVAISVSGNMFGGTASGSLVLGIIRLDANGNRIAGQDLTTPVAQRVLYGGIQAGFNFGGMSGFDIRIGVSELGPLQVYLSIAQAQILEPISGLAITNFRAGVTFNTELPSITDPLKLRDPQFKPAAELTLEQWVAQLEAAVVNQARAPPSANFWNVFTQPMRIEGGATLFSAYASTGSFRADVDIIFDTRGKVVINARGVFGGTFSLNFKLYADLTQIQNSGAFLFLAELPQNPSTLTLRGGVQFKFLQADGTPATSSAQATSFFLSLSGGVDATLLNIGSITVEATINLTFTSTRTTIDFNGSLKMGPLGDAVKAAGKFVFQNAGNSIELWGVARLEVKFNQLESKGIFAEGSALLQINTTTRDVSESIALPGESAVEFKLKSLAFSVVINGALQMKRDGANWFRLEGLFVADLTTNGLDVYVDANVLVGDPKSPLVTLKGTGYLAIRSNGVAARIDLTLVGAFGGAASKLTLDATFQLVFNTTGADVTYTLPATAIPVNGSRTVSVSGRAPGATTASWYFYLDIRGSMTIDGAFTLTNGTFTLLVTPSTVRLEASARFDLTASSTKLLGFDVSGGFDFSSDGVAGMFSLTLRQGEGVPTSQGWSLTGTFRIEFNTKSAPVTLNDVVIPVGTRVFADGTLSVGGFSLVGTFYLSVSSSNIRVEATAKLPIKVGNTTVLTLEVSGGLDVSSTGIATVLNASLANNGGVPSSQGWSFAATFRLEFNTRKNANESVTLAGVTVPPGTLQIFAAGVVTASGFALDGTFYLRISGSDVTLAATATVTVLSTKINVAGSLGIYSDGLAFKISVNVPEIKSAAMTVKGTFTLAVNTSKTRRFDIAAGSGYLSAEKVELSLAGFKVSGTVRITSKGRIDIPSADPLKLSVLGQTASLSGYIEMATGYFDLTGKITLNIGNKNVAQISGDLNLRLYRVKVGNKESSGFDGTFSAVFNAFGIKIADLKGSTALKRDGSFQLSLSSSFTLATFVSITGSFSIQVDASRNISLTFNGNFNVFNRFKASLSGYADTRTGKWNLAGWASASFGGSNLGASASLSVILGNTPYELTTIPWNQKFSIDPGLYLSGSAWAKVTVAGIKFGIEGSFSTRLTSERASVHVEGSVCVGICVSASKTVGINFRTGEVWLSDIGDAVVFFDANRNGLHDPGEPITRTTATGSFSFEPVPENLPDTPAPRSLLAQLDRNGDGQLTEDEGRFLLTGGRAIADGTANSETIALNEGALAGVSDYSGATVFFDANLNGVRDPGEFSVTTDASGAYSFTEVFVQASGILNHLGRLQPFDKNNNGVLDDDEGSLVLLGGTSLADGSANSQSILLGAAEGHALYSGATVFLDLNRNGRPDAGEPATQTDADGFYHFDDHQDPVEAATLGLLASFDRNGNGVIDPDEGVLTLSGGRLIAAQPDLDIVAGAAFTGTATLDHNTPTGLTLFAGATVFLDVNGNGRLDANEPHVITSGNGGYSFDPETIAQQVAALGRLAAFDQNRNGHIDPNEGRLARLGGVLFGDEETHDHDDEQLFEANSPSGMLHWRGAIIFLDVNGNGQLDADEPRTITDAEGFYTFLAATDFNNDLGALKSYDRNGNGVLDPEEGVFVITGGVDRHTGLTNQRTLTVLATNYGSIFGTQLSPLSELYTYLVLGGLSLEQANEVMYHAFGLPHTTDILTFNPDDSLGLEADGESSAKLVSTLAQAGAEIIEMLGELAGRVFAHGEAEDFVIRALADHVRRLGPPPTTEVDADGNHIGGTPALDLHDVAVLRAILGDAIARAGLAAPPADRFTAALTALDGFMDWIVALRAAQLTDITGALARVSAVLHVHFHAALDELFSGQLSVAAFGTRFSAEGIRELMRNVDIPEDNAAPTVSLLGTSNVVRDDTQTPIAVALRVADPDNAPGDVAIRAVSSNEFLIPSSAVTITGEGASRTVLVSPLAGRTGTATITLLATDGQNLETGEIVREFTVTIVYTYAALMNDLAIRARFAAEDAATNETHFADAAAAEIPLARSVTDAAEALIALSTPSDLLGATALAVAETPRPLRRL